MSGRRTKWLRKQFKLQMGKEPEKALFLTYQHPEFEHVKVIAHQTRRNLFRLFKKLYQEEVRKGNRQKMIEQQA